LDWLGAMVIGDSSGFAGTYDKGDTSYKPPKIISLDEDSEDGGENQLGAGRTRVRTTFDFDQEIQTLANAMLVNSSWSDQSVDFRQYTKIMREKVDETNFDDDAVIHEFTHPITLVTYQAPQTPDQNSISAKLVAWANQLKTKWEYAQCLEQTFDPSKTTTDYLKDECGDRDLPFAIDTSSQQTIQQTRDRLDNLETVRLRQLEEVVAKMTRMRDIYQLTDIE